MLYITQNWGGGFSHPLNPPPLYPPLRTAQQNKSRFVPQKPYYIMVRKNERKNNPGK